MVKDIIEFVLAGSFKATSSDLLDLENLDLESSLLLLVKVISKFVCMCGARKACRINEQNFPTRFKYMTAGILLW